MTKIKLEIESICGVGTDGAGNYIVLIFTNYGALTYDTETKKYELNDYVISEEDFELENIHKEAMKAIAFFKEKTGF